MARGARAHKNEHGLDLQRPVRETLGLRRAVRQCARQSPAAKFRSDAELPQTAEVDGSAAERLRELTLMVFVDWHLT